MDIFIITIIIFSNQHPYQILCG